MATELLSETGEPVDGFVETAPSEPRTCKRHRWLGGNTCVNCGALRERVTRQTGVTRTRGSSRTGDLETFISMAWMGMGFAVQHRVWTHIPGMPQPDLENKPDVAGPVGYALRIEAAVAGRRIDRTLRKTTIYGPLVKFFTPIGVVSDLAPLALPPLVVGMAAFKPEAIETLKPILIPMLAPIFAEAAKLAEQQRQLLGKVEAINDETLQNTSDFIDSIINSSKREREDVNGSQAARPRARERT